MFPIVAYDVDLHAIVLLQANAPTGRLWLYDGHRWQASPPLKGGQTEHFVSTMGTYDDAAKAFVLLGTRDGMTDQTWAYSGARWQRIRAQSPPFPGAMFADSELAFDPALGGDVLLEPVTTRRGLNMQTWLLSRGSWRQLHPSRAPSARSTGALAFDPELATLTLFGGQTPVGSALGDLWDFNGRTWTTAPNEKSVSMGTACRG